MTLDAGFRLYQLPTVGRKHAKTKAPKATVKIRNK
jgi:hypothetical protein